LGVDDHNDGLSDYSDGNDASEEAAEYEDEELVDGHLYDGIQATTAKEGHYDAAEHDADIATQEYGYCCAFCGSADDYYDASIEYSAYAQTRMDELEE
jgi:hypothetical protein